MYTHVYPANSNGKLIYEDIQGHSNNYVPQKLADNLSLTEIDNNNFTGVAYSKQNDGSFLFVFHIPSDSIKLNNVDIERLRNSETVVFGSEDAADQANSQYYGYNNKTGQILTGKDSKPLGGLPIALETYISTYYTDPNNYNGTINYQILNAQGKTLLQSVATPAKANGHASTKATVYVHYLNIDTGMPISNEVNAEVLPAGNPGAKNSVNLPQGLAYSHYHLVTKINQNGNVITLGNGRTITLGSNDTVVIPKAGATSFDVTYPSQEGQIGNVYVFYQGDDEQGEVQFLDADTKDAKGPNGYKLLETKQTNKGHYGSNFSFPAGQDPETILNHYVYTAHYQYQPASKLNQEANAYRFNKTYSYTDKANNNRGNVYYIYLNHATTPLNRTVKRTIRYIKSDGTPMTGVSDQVQTVTFTGSHDLVTNTDNWNANPDNTFGAVPSKQISGYTVS